MSFAAQSKNMKKKSVFLIVGVLILCRFAPLSAQELLDKKIKSLKIDTLQFIQIDGFIEVPENRALASSKTLRLPVRIVKTPNITPLEPVFYLDGGPGYSNIGTTLNTDLLRHRDFVFVGYRGADGSVVLRSKKMFKALKGQKNHLLSDKSLNSIEAASKAYLAELKKKEIDITQYSIMQVIDDVEQARKILGYSKINLLSFSYGTRIALLYSYKYPTSLNRIVMAGANPPGHFLWYPDKTEQVLDKWDKIYVAYGKGSLKEAMKKAFDNMPRTWRLNKLDVDKIKAITFALMSTNETSVMAFDSYFRAANRKDYSGLYLMQFLFDTFMKKVIWGEMFAKGASADWQDGTNYRETLRKAGETTILGANLSLLLWGSMAEWDKTLIPEEYRKLRVSEIETLIVSGDLDVSTPTDFAKEKLLPNLPKSQHVILENTSHADIPLAQSQNYFKLINSFYDTGKADSTVFSEQKIELIPKRKFYKMAKWGFPVIMVLKWLN